MSEQAKNGTTSHRYQCLQRHAGGTCMQWWSLIYGQIEPYTAAFKCCNDQTIKQCVLGEEHLSN